MGKERATAEQAAGRSKTPALRKWALMFAFAVSVLLHAFLGVGVSRLIGAQKAERPAAPNDTLTIRMVAAAPKAPIADKGTTPEKTPEIAVPTPAPRPAAPEPTPTPRPTPKAEKPRPSERAVPRREARVTPVEAPKQKPAPGAGNPLPKRKPAPLPRGRRDGAPKITVTPTEPRVAPRPPAPQPVKNLDSESGTPAASAPVIAKTVEPAPTAPAENAAPPSLVTGKAPDATTGDGAGSGKTDALGINRGIPFGDALGITKGGNPNGGAGIGVRGAGGSGGKGRDFGRIETYVPGKPQFTLARPSRSDEGPPIHIVYVIDTSGSMDDGGKMRRVREAMDKALRELRDEDYFNIVFFADKATLFSPAMRPATQSNVGAGILMVGVASPGGATNLSAALDLAFAQSDATHIFVMSDGEPTEGVTDFNTIIALAREKNRHNARIMTLALGQGEKFKGMGLLRQLAEAGHGTFNYIDLRRQ